MKSQIHLLSSLIAVLIITSSCSKSKSLPTPDRHVAPQWPFMVNRDYFWGEGWQKTATGYEMKLPTQRLTDSAINKGIRVGLAIFSDWSGFETLPFTIDDPSYYADTINLSYTAIPGNLTVVAKTSVNITWASDVFIQY